MDKSQKKYKFSMHVLYEIVSANYLEQKELALDIISKYMVGIIKINY